MNNETATRVYLGLQHMYSAHLQQMYPGMPRLPLTSLKLYESGIPDVACEFLVKENNLVFTRYIMFNDCRIQVEVDERLVDISNKNIISGMFEGLNNMCYACEELSDVVYKKDTASGVIALSTKEYISCKVTGRGVQIINTEK